MRNIRLPVRRPMRIIPSWITEKDICVEKTTEAAQIMYDSLTLVKELTTSYYYIAMQSKESALYQAPQGWFPLPFFLPEADAF